MKRKRTKKPLADMKERATMDGSRQFIITLHGATFKNPLPSDFALEFVSHRKRRQP